LAPSWLANVPWLILIEMAATVASLICVWLAVRGQRLTWLIGLLAVVLYALVFWRARLYANLLLQAVFFAQNAYGWFYWRTDRSQPPLTRLSIRSWGGALAAIAFLTPAYAWLVLALEADARYPWVDGLTAAMGLVANLLLARRVLDSWLIWLVTDAILTFLFIRTGLWPSVALYAVLTGMAVNGYLTWRQMWRAEQTLPAK
jgi:nicotinamide mononucleotide transporter